MIAALATSVVFAMTLIMAGMSNGLDREVDRIVDSFAGDRWVVARGASGPFTATKFVVDDDIDAVKRAPGVRAASPMVTARATIGTSSLTDVNLIGYVPGGVGAPKIEEGRAPKQEGEIVVDGSLDQDIGDVVVVSGQPARVVGKAADLRYNFGVHTIFMTLEDAQNLSFAWTAAFQRGDHEGNTASPSGRPERPDERRGQDRSAAAGGERQAVDRLHPGAPVDRRRGDHRPDRVSHRARSASATSQC